MDTVTATIIGTTLIFDYHGQESDMRMSNINHNATNSQLLDFGRAINMLQRTNADLFHREVRTELA